MRSACAERNLSSLLHLSPTSFATSASPSSSSKGRHDPYTPSSVAKSLLDKINAPAKDFVWLEDSGHFPFTEEPTKLTDTLVQKILPCAR
jgi:proline iminopeptidase